MKCSLSQLELSHLFLMPQKNPHFYIYTSSISSQILVLFLSPPIKQKIIVSFPIPWLLNLRLITSANQMFHSETVKFDEVKEKNG